MPIISDILNVVKETGCLGNSPRQHDLLEYLLRENEVGRTERIKAYSIAVDVLGRPEDFDTSVDSIVRVEMHRLRKGLALFNAGESVFTLSIPKASYTIHIEQKPEAATPNASFVPTKRPRTVLIFTSLLIGCACLALVYFVNPAHNRSQTMIDICSPDRPHAILGTTKIVGDITADTSKAIEINTYLRIGLAQYSKINLVPEGIECGSIGGPSYSIQPTLFNMATTPFVSIEVKELKSQSVIFSQEIMLSDVAGTQEQPDGIPYYKTASQLAHASGVIPQDAVSRNWGVARKKQGYQCQIDAYQYFITNDPHTYITALKCMESVTNATSQNPDILGLLAIFYVEQARGYQPKTRETPLQYAEVLLKQARTLSPFNPEVLIGQLRLESEHQPADANCLENTLEIIERQHPYNAHILLVASQIAGYKLGNWPYAHKLSQRTLTLNHSNSYAVHYVEAAYALLYEEPSTAYTIAQTAYSPNSRIAIILNLAAANRAGKYEDAAKHRESLRTFGSETLGDYTQFIAGRHYEPKLTQELIKWVGVSP